MINGKALPHSSFALLPLRDALRTLDRVAEGVPLATFGQTPLWDEPMKMIIAAAAKRRTIVGIHDLDYFSRLRAPLPGERWQIVPRNDGVQRETWVAAGELSALFGAEIWPTRQALASAGVRVDRLLTAKGAARQQKLDKLTEAWGWRGIAQNVSEPSVICDVKVREVAPALLDLLRWGGDQSARSLRAPSARRTVRQGMGRLAEVVEGFAAERPEASLIELYETLYREICERLLGEIPDNVSFESTRRLFTFNRRTAGLPRFKFVSHFLDPTQTETACAAYDEAVGESAMLLLRSFGPGALPFDVYVPGKGRGTLHVTPQALRIGLPQPVNISLAKPVETVADLAGALEDALGPDIALVGKAVTLFAMLCGEFVMVLNEGASVYIPRTRQMLGRIRESGIPLSTHPILRMRLNTWGAMRDCDVELSLPEHLAQAFGKKTLASAELGRRWRRVVREQDRLLQKLSDLVSPCELVRYLGYEEHEGWFAKLTACMKANTLLLDVQRRADGLRHQTLELRSREDEVQEEIRTIEKRRGELNRTRLRPLKRKLNGACGDVPAADLKRLRCEHDRAEREGKALLLALEAKQAERRRLRSRRRQVGEKLRATEHSARAVAARRKLHATYRAAEKARFRLMRNAILASDGLRRTNLRPSAWWMPIVDPSGRWFDRIRRTARFYLEPLPGEQP